MRVYIFIGLTEVFKCSKFQMTEITYIITSQQTYWIRILLVGNLS
jgi:hypothetical protein